MAGLGWMLLVAGCRRYPVVSEPRSFDSDGHQDSGAPVSEAPDTAYVCDGPMPTHWWPGDGSAEDIVAGADGALMGTATYADGLSGTAFALDGVSAFVSLDDLLDTAAGTVEGWFVRDGAPAEGGDVVYFGSVSFRGGVTNRSPTLWTSRAVTGRDDRLIWEIGDVGVVVSDASLPEGEWHHVAMTWQLAGRLDARLYVDGLPAGRIDAGLPFSPFAAPLVGAYADGGPIRDFADARVDELATWDRTLSADEIAAIVAAGAAGRCRP